MTAHACLENEFTEEKKYHNLTRGLIYFVISLPLGLMGWLRLVIVALPGHFIKFFASRSMMKQAFNIKEYMSYVTRKPVFGVCD